MSIKTVRDLLSENLIFQDLPELDLELIAGCATNVHFKANALIAQEDQPADCFYLIRSGKLSLDMHVPNQEPRSLQSLGKGQVVGWSWIFPPYLWTYDVRALEDSALIRLDGKCLREKCEWNHSMGYRLMRTFAALIVARTRCARLQLIDLYGGGRNHE